MSEAVEGGNGRTSQDAIALFTFLKELTELRMKAVRSVDQYDHVLWFNDIPRENDCFCVAWNLGREEAENVGAWVEIQKPRLVPPPTPGTLLEPWLVPGQIEDSSREMPALREEIAVHVGDIEGSEEAFERHILEDHPEVSEAWERYVKEKWWPWAQIDQPLRRVQRVYTDLFTIYQRQQRLGEQYEVLLGLGLLIWQTPDGQTVKRHLITAQTSLEFEAARGIIRVGSAGEGPRPNLEQDMLDPKDRPDPRTVEALEGQVSEIGDDIWDKTRLDSALKGWVHAASSNGTYDDTLAPPKVATSDPRIHLSPAIILRRRTERSFLRAFKEIIEQLEEGKTVPAGVGEFTTPANGRKESPTAYQTSADNGPSEVYFPLVANEQQREIVQRLGTHQGILVQGPPGTGKSHTIVNLVCHLLASGKRILVTSHTARALRVLRRFFEEHTPEVAPLAVVLLGDDRESLEAMEVSVQGIMDRHNQWDPRANERAIDDGELDLRSSKEKEADIFTQIRAIRENETYMHPRKFDNYDGTLQQIGEQLRAEQVQYDWIPDCPSEDSEPPLSNQDAQELLRLLRDDAVTEAESWGWEPVNPADGCPPPNL